MRLNQQVVEYKQLHFLLMVKVMKELNRGTVQRGLKLLTLIIQIEEVLWLLDLTQML